MLRDALGEAVSALAVDGSARLADALPLLFEEVALARALPFPSGGWPRAGASWSAAAEAEARRALAPWAEPGVAERLGEVYQGLVTTRRASGSFYTPPHLVSWVLERTLDASAAATGGVPTLLDPTCGAGHFLVPAARRLAEPSGSIAAAVAGSVRGLDLDPLAVDITRFLLWLADPAIGYDVLASRIRVGNALTVDWSAEFPDELADGAGGFDVVLGNPPFLNQLRRDTMRSADEDSSLRRGGHVGAYTDTSAVLLRRALDLVRPGGRVAMVQPKSVLATRDAAAVRSAATRSGALTDLWSSDTPVFADTSVLTCVPVVHVGAPQGPVRVWQGPRLRRVPDVVAEPQRLAGEWGFLTAGASGVPAVALADGAGVVGDEAQVTADFRDQYYGLVPFVREAVDGVVGPGEAALVTTGLIDPAQCRWGEAGTRFARRRYVAPVVDVDGLAGGSLAPWASARLVPKVLVATQGRVIEAVVDVEGRWLPSVPTLSVVASPERLWHVLAVLLAPPVVAHAAARYAGAGLSPGAIKLSAGQLRGLPLPGDAEAWDAGAAAARAAQESRDPGRRASHLAECARLMGLAYGDESALSWWLDRARLAPQGEKGLPTPAGDRRP